MNRAGKIGQVRYDVIAGGLRTMQLGITIVAIHHPPQTTHTLVVHKKSDEWLSVIEGTAVGKIGKKKVFLRKGMSVFIPRGEWHFFKTGRGWMKAISVFKPSIDLKNPDVFVQASVKEPNTNKGRQDVLNSKKS